VSGLYYRVPNPFSKACEYTPLSPSRAFESSGSTYVTYTTSTTVAVFVIVIIISNYYFNNHITLILLIVISSLVLFSLVAVIVIYLLQVTWSDKMYLYNATCSRYITITATRLNNTRLLITISSLVLFSLVAVIVIYLLQVALYKYILSDHVTCSRYITITATRLNNTRLLITISSINVMIKVIIANNNNNNNNKNSNSSTSCVGYLQSSE